MAHIALIQNQSEMANYSHADCRNLLGRLDHTYKLFTGSNIEQLSHGVSSGLFDSVIIASNALHDNVIRNYFEDGNGKNVVNMLLDQMCGLLVLMQYKAASDKYSFSFLPEPFDRILAVARPSNETAVESVLSSTGQKYSPPLMHYPTSIEVQEVEKSGSNHKTLKGVYWHFWGGDIDSFWDRHLSCQSDKQSARPLVLSAKEAYNKRIVACSLPVDWHSHNDLFQNILSYVSEGRHFTAVVKSTTISSPAFDYFIETLKVRKEGFHLYTSEKEQFNKLAINSGLGIHRTIVLGPSVANSGAFDEQDERIQDRIQHGDLRIISFGDGFSGQYLSISGRHNPALNIYRLLIPQISKDLQNGFLDGSFWSTVSGLKAIERLPDGLDSELFPLNAVLKLATKHDRKGSYDEVFGATVALLWLITKADNVDIDSELTLEWLRDRISDVDDTEKIRALTLLSNIEEITAEEKVLLAELLQQCSPEKSSEFDLLTLLGSAVEISDEAQIIRFVRELSNRQDSGLSFNGIWVDIPTTAGLVLELVKCHETLSSGKQGDPTSIETIRNILIPAMIALEESFQRSTSSIVTEDQYRYPWDGKASTCLRCLAAWYHFDRFLDAPVTVAADSVNQASGIARTTAIAENSLGSLRYLSTDNELLTMELIRASSAFRDKEDALVVARDARRRASWAVFFSRFFLLAAIVQAYFIGDHLVRTIIMGEKLSFLQSVPEHTSTHVGVTMFIIALLAVPWGKSLGILSFILPKDSENPDDQS